MAAERTAYPTPAVVMIPYWTTVVSKEDVAAEDAVIFGWRVVVVKEEEAEDGLPIMAHTVR